MIRNVVIALTFLEWVIGNLESGYLVDEDCNYCGAHNKLSKTSSVELNIIKEGIYETEIEKDVQVC